MNTQKIVNTRKKFLAAIKKTMEEKKVSQTKFAKKYKLQQANVSRYLAGEGAPNLDVVIKFAEALNCKLVLQPNEPKGGYKVNNGEKAGPPYICGICHKPFDNVPDWVEHVSIPH